MYMNYGGGKNRQQKKEKKENKKTGQNATGKYNTKHIRLQQERLELAQKRTKLNNVDKKSNKSNNKKGGGYSYIVNPVTNRKVNVNGIIGQQIIKNYLVQLQ